MPFRLTAFDLVTVSPADDLLRTVIFVIPAAILAYLSLYFLRKVSLGSTIIVNPKNVPGTFRVFSGKQPLSSRLEKQGYLKSYNGPGASAFLGLLMFAVAEFLIVMIFKRVDYFFSPL